MRVEAFRSKQDVEKVKRRLRNHKDKRLYPMFIISLNTGLRISDVVPLKRGDFTSRGYLIVKSEEKTNKRREIVTNKAIREILDAYYSDLKVNEYLFKSQKGGHICEDYAYQLLKAEYKKCRFKYNTGTHSTRKTYGKELNEKYDIDMAQIALGHDNQRDTLRYIGKEREMLDSAILSLNL